MRSSEKCGAIAKALIEARKSITVVPKSGHNKFDKYDYSTHEDFIKACIVACLNAGVIVTQSTHGAVYEMHDKAGSKTPFRCHLSMTTRATHADTGEWIEVDSEGDGFDRNDKTPYKATTGASKYGLRNLLGLATSDDPEAYEEDEKPKRGGNGKGGSGGTRTPVEPDPADDAGDDDDEDDEGSNAGPLATVSKEFVNEFEGLVHGLDSASKMKDTGEVLIELAGSSFDPKDVIAQLTLANKLKPNLLKLKKAMSAHPKYANVSTIEVWNVVVRKADGKTAKITDKFIDQLTKAADAAAPKADDAEAEAA